MMLSPILLLIAIGVVAIAPIECKCVAGVYGIGYGLDWIYHFVVGL